MEKERNYQAIIIEQLSQDLEDLAKYLKDLWAFLPLPLIYTNPLFIILDVNPAFEELLQKKSEELISESLEKLFGKASGFDKVLKELSEKGKVKSKEIGIVIKNEKKFLSVSATCRKNEEEEIIGYYLSFIDITDLKEIHLYLEEKVKERSQELQEKVTELEKFQKMAIGRELKMIELKEKIKELEERIKQLMPSEKIKIS